MSCPFCEIPEIKERMIAENELAWAFPSSQPIVPGHTLVIPKRCVPTFEELTAEERDAIFELMVQLKEAMKKTFHAHGFNHAWNQGDRAGQSVAHFHLHIVPRSDDDAGVHEYEPRLFLYRPGSRENSPQEELKAVAEQIKAAMSDGSITARMESKVGNAVRRLSDK